MIELDIFIGLPLLALLLVAVATDWRARRIPNGLTFGGAVVGLLLQAALQGPVGLVLSIAGWTVCLVCFLPFYMSGGMAAGDVKLMAAVGAFLGPLGGLAAALCALVAGALIGALCLGYHRVAHAGGESRSEEQNALAEDLRRKIPYAGAIAIGTVVAVLQPQLLLAGLRQSGGLA